MPAVLIPRPETELIIEEFLARLPLDAPARPRRIADIGTGSGCLAVTAAAERPYLEVVATDISEAALHVAHENAGRYGVSDRIAFRESAYSIGARPGCSTSSSRTRRMSPRTSTSGSRRKCASTNRRSALVAGEDGFRDIRQIVDLGTAYLAPGGTMLIEIGYEQADAVVDLVTELSVAAARRHQQRPAEHPARRGHRTQDHFVTHRLQSVSNRCLGGGP